MGMLPVKAVYHFFIPRLCAYQCSRCDFCYISQHQSWLIFYFIAALVVALSLWRINRVHNPVALICEKKLLVAVPWSFINSDYHISFRAFYMPVEYNEVAGVSHNWSQLYIGVRITGAWWPFRYSFPTFPWAIRQTSRTGWNGNRKKSWKIHKTMKRSCDTRLLFFIFLQAWAEGRCNPLYQRSFYLSGNRCSPHIHDTLFSSSLYFIFFIPLLSTVRMIG